MNNKGFAVTGILYTVLVIFLVSITIMLFNLQNRKTILDTLKADTVEAVEENNNFEYLLQRIEELEGKTATVDTIYPVGSIYITTSNVNPSELFPGTEWSSYSEGRTIVGHDGTNYVTNDMSKGSGGISTVTLSDSNLPSHSHDLVYAKANSISGSTAITVAQMPSHSHTATVRSSVVGQGGATNYIIDGGGQSLLNNIAIIGNTGGNQGHTHTIGMTNTTATTSTCNNCNGSSFSVQNPYVVVYMWKRTK